jgi:crotonobetainyl-CoA:carnitine CoA-transferase CaiB-like acyl-CoA transferase
MYEVMLRMGQYFMMDYFNGGEICPRMTKGKDPTMPVVVCINARMATS